MFRVDMEFNPGINEVEPIKVTPKTVTFIHPRLNYRSREILDTTYKYQWFNDYAPARARLIEHCDLQIERALTQISKYEAVKTQLPNT